MEILVLVCELVFLALTLAVIWFVLGMEIRATLGIRAQRFYNAVSLLPVNIILTPVWFFVFVVQESRFHLVRDNLFLGFFGVDPSGGGPDKEQIVWRKLGDLRLKWLDDRVNVRRARVAKGFTQKDRSFFSDLAAKSHQELRFGCKIALACDYKVPSDLEETMGLSMVMRVLRRVTAAI